MEDYILNGTAYGSVAAKLIANGGDPLALRPFLGPDNRPYVLTQNQAGVFTPQPVWNADATLRKDEWIQLDEAVLKAALPRLRAVDDLRSRGLTYVIPNGMGKTVFQSEKMSDINDATMSMDGIREGDDDRPVFDIENLPLPIIHKDFHFSARQILASRNGNTPLDTSMAEAAARKVAEMAEKLLLGVSTFATYGGGTIYGYTNWPSVLTQTLTSPTLSAWTGTTLLTEVLAMCQSSRDAYYYGPWMLYNAPNWDQYLGQDFKTNSDKSVRQRVSEVEGIQGIRTLDYLTNYDMILVQMTTEVVREIIGMDIQTLQWDTQGGMRVNFKVMAIMVPQLRADYNGNTGIVYGSV